MWDSLLKVDMARKKKKKKKKDHAWISKWQ